MYMKCYVDEPDSCQIIAEAQAREELGHYHRNVEEVLDCIRMGGKARTPWAFYTWTLTDAPAVERSVPCPLDDLLTPRTPVPAPGAGEAAAESSRPATSYADYFRRGLISVSEWRRLEIENLSK